MNNSKTLRIFKKNPNTGIWILESTRDKSKFIVNNIDAFIPEGKGPESKIKFKTHSGVVDSLIITSYSTKFDASKENDRHNINVLINHPRVRLLDEDPNVWEEMVSSRHKVPNPEWVLKSVDLEEDEKYEEELELISVRFWLMNKKNPISLKKAVYLASMLGVQYYRESRDYNGKPETLRNRIVKNIDNEIQRNKSSLEKVIKFKDDIDAIERMYFIEEFIQSGLIKYEGTVYYLGNLPLGVDKEAINTYLDHNIETYNTLKRKIVEQKKGTNFEEVVKSE